MSKPATPMALVLSESDNVAVLLANVLSGTEVRPGVIAAQRVSRGHKLAIAPIQEGEPVRKFGQTIGFATRTITPGEWVHEHNCGMGPEGGTFRRNYDFGAGIVPVDYVPHQQRATFEGFRRSNGKVGTRNYIGILTSVNCSATVARYIAEAVERSGMLDDYPSIDGIVSFVHQTGCGMSGKGEGFDLLARTQWGYAANPNLGAVLMVGLGCEVFQIGRMKQLFGIAEDETFQTLTIQGEGGTRKAIEQGLERVRAMLPVAARAQRETIPASELILALQCGGSDGYSGITANPALGAAVDMLVSHGGTAILSETTEIYGAEHLLTRRAARPAVGQKLIERIRWWEEYCARNGAEMNNNPSPGNKAGGLTTILEKSLGAAAKAGTTPLNAVYEYAEPVTERGVVFMDTPGFDPVSATGQVAGGANVLCFTTGRGSAFGCKPVPSIKLATNSELYARMQEDMDINCGDILEGVTLEYKGFEIFQHILDVASGKKTKSEELGYGDNEFAPWQVGAVM